MSVEIENIRSKPLYNPQTGKLRGWELSWVIKDGPVTAWPSKTFYEGRFRNSYKAMCRFTNDLLAKQNENNK